MRRIEMAGKKFGRLTCIERDGYVGKEIAYLFKCECGSTTRVIGAKVRSGHTKSCGCLQKEAAVENGRNNKIYGLPLWFRFLSNIDCTGDCWEWQGAKATAGYGHTSLNHNKISTHVLSYKMFKGPIYPSLVIRHTCDNPGCCNPDHLLIGTHRDNIHDSIRRGRSPHLSMNTNI